MTNNCIAIANKAAAGRLTTDEVNKIVEETDAIKERLTLAGITDNLDNRAVSIAMRDAMEKKIETARAKRQIAQNIKVRDRLNPQVDIFMKSGMSPVNSIIALWQGAQKLVKGARASGYANGLAYENSWLGHLFYKIETEQPHIMKLMRGRGAKDFDTAVTKELWELREGGSPGITGNKDAQWLASHLATHMEIARTELNRLGAAIGKLNGYAGPQVHDDMAMLKAGRDKWVNDILPMLDQERSFPDATSEGEVKGILARVYDTIITGIHDNQSDPLLTGKRVGPSNLGKSLGKHRVLHFKDAETAINYRDSYGRGSTIQGIFAQLRKNAHAAGAMDKFGTNPRAMVLSVAAKIQSDLRAKVANETDPKKLATLKNHIDSLASNNGEIVRLAATLDDLTGISHRPVSITTAYIGSTIRAAQSMAKLGGAVITSLPSDTTTMASSAMFRGTGLWSGYARSIGELANHKAGKQVGYLFGEGVDGMMGHIANAAVVNDAVPGAIAKSMDTFFKWSGLSGWTDAARGASARVISAELGMFKDKAFTKLYPALQKVLEANGIDAVKWDAMRTADLLTVNGRHYMAPDAMRNLPDHVVETTVADKIAEARAALKNDAKFEAKRQRLISDARRELEMDLQRYFADETSAAVIETDAASRRITTGAFIFPKGTQSGTFGGEAIRMLMQFKGYPVAFSNRILGRAFKNIPEGGMNRFVYATNIAQMTAAFTVAGYAALTVKDMARGIWPPRNPFSYATFIASLVQGGGAGIYGDFVFGQKSRYDQSAWATLGGPMVGNAEDLYRTYSNARQGEFNAGKAVDMVINNTPYINLFYTRTALDILFINALREAVSPGYLDRQRVNMNQARHQDFVLPRTIGEMTQQ